MAPAHPLILRSPPFPGIPPAVAAIGVPLAAALREAVETMGPLIAAMRAARVGGTFWAAQPDIAAGSIVVRVAGPEDVSALADRAVAEPDLVALLPASPWARRLAPKLRHAGIVVLIGDVDPWWLYDRAARLEVPGDDELALLGLIAGVPVSCISSGRFAGRGLTIDRPGVAAEAPVTLEMLAAEALLAARYRDCFTGAATGIGAAIDRLADWRRLIDTNRAITVAAGIAVWKRREVARLLWNGGGPVRFARSTSRAVRLAAAAGGGIAAWPSRVAADLPAAAAAAAVPLLRIEDGFIRSVGLGSNLHPPLSIVADARGIYYDPAVPSDLETLLADHPFDPALLDRARRLADAIVRAGISKYSSGMEPYRIDAPAGRRVVLVAGQVEDDLSVRLGGGGVAGNRDLLARARAAEPDAYILFKPHPDVDAGHRIGRIDDADALRFADRVVRDVPMPALLGAVDGIHVLTSLAGYEALLRGRDVTVHGGPFYAGWGLTRDLGPPLPRRTRRLSIDELTAAALILYPRYLDPVSGLPCPPETLVHRLASQPRPRQTTLIRVRRLQGWLRRAYSPVGRLA